MAVYPVDQEGVDDFAGLFVGHYQQLLRLVRQAGAASRERHRHEQLRVQLRRPAC